MNVFVEAWLEARPLVIKLFADFLIFPIFWVMLWIVHMLSIHMPLGGPVGMILVYVHESALALTYALLTLLAAWDIWKFKTGHHQ